MDKAFYSFIVVEHLFIEDWEQSYLFNVTSFDRNSIEHREHAEYTDLNPKHNLYYELSILRLPSARFQGIEVIHQPKCAHPFQVVHQGLTKKQLVPAFFIEFHLAFIQLSL